MIFLTVLKLRRLIFLDSLDKKGATAPRWNFTDVTPKIMEKFLTYNPMYLLSVDLDGNYKIRIRIWTVNVDKHDVLKERYILWMNTKGYKKFANNKNESVNFQLFPPRMFKNETCARHGNNRANVTMVAKYLGHSKIDETLNTYSHVFQNKLDDIVNTLDSLE